MTTDASTTRQAYWASLLLLIVFYGIVGFYPFKLAPLSAGLQHNGAALTTAGLHFRSAGIAYTPEAPGWLQHAIATSLFEMSLEVRTADEDQYGPARIFTLSANPVRRNITVGQSGSSLIVRVRTPRTSLNGIPEYRMKNIFAEPGWHQIDILISGKVLEIRVDGESMVFEHLTDPALSVWDNSYRAALGNEFSGDRPWLGEIRKAVVRGGDQSFDFLTPGALHIADEFSINPANPANPAYYSLIPKQQFNNTAILDWTVNFLGFAPFGWLVGILRRPHSGILLATLLAATLSATIEISQLFFLLDRYPSSVDLLLNSLGASVGAWVANNYDLIVKKRPGQESLL